MSDGAETSARRTSIVLAARHVFLRYGFKKTSMDDLARAAGLSRQGLYLHFPTKEALFRDVVFHMVTETSSAGRAALGRQDLDVEAKLLAGFEAVHGDFDRGVADNMAELLETAVELAGPAVTEWKQGFLAEVTRVLKEGGVARSWKHAGVTARQLAQHLDTVSSGLKHTVTTREGYREGMRIAIRIVCRGGEAHGV